MLSKIIKRKVYTQLYTMFCSSILQSQSCLGDLSRCLHGLTVSGWFNFKDLEDNMWFLDSGERGVRLYYKDNHLVGEFQQGNRNWKVKFPSPNRGRSAIVCLPKTGKALGSFAILPAIGEGHVWDWNPNWSLVTPISSQHCGPRS